MAGTPHRNLVTARVICGALIFSAVMIWLMALALTGGGRDPMSTGFPVGSVGTTLIGLAVGLGGVAAARYFHSRSGATSPASAGRESRSLECLSRLQTNLLVAWAILEGTALLLAVLFLLTGTFALPVIALGVLLHGFASTFPRAAWYPPAPPSR
jgi:hypothetical protein